MTDTWTAVYDQFGVRDEEETDSLDEAVTWLWGGEELGRLYAVDIRRPDGESLGEAEVRRLLDERDRRAG